MLHTHSFTYHPRYIMSLPVLQFSPVSIIPSIIHTHLYLHTALIRRRNGWSLGALGQSSTLSGIWQYCMEKYFHSPYLHGLAIDLLSNSVGRFGMDSSGLRYGPVAGCCEHGNEPSGSTKTAIFMSSWYCGPCSVQSVGRVCHLLTGLCHWPLPELIARPSESCSVCPGCNVIAEHLQRRTDTVCLVVRELPIGTTKMKIGLNYI